MSHGTHDVNGPAIVGVVNLGPDSFSDGRPVDAEGSIVRAREQRAAGATIVELGPTSSHPNSPAVSVAEEMRRLQPVVEGLLDDEGMVLSVDSYQGEVLLWAAGQGVAMVNDVHGFDDPEIRSALAAHHCRLVVVHSIFGAGTVGMEDSDAATIVDRACEFLARRTGELEAAGVHRDRLVIDPGLGFFVGANPEASVEVLANVAEIRAAVGLPIMIAASRKSFLGALTGRPLGERLPASLAAELAAADAGVDYIRTHDSGALRDALLVTAAISARQR